MQVITCHNHADFDCLGAMSAAARLYPGAKLCVPGAMEKAVREFAARHPGYMPPLTRAKEIDLDLVDTLVVVDCQDASRIGRLADLVDRPGVAVHIYDHHPITEHSITPSGGLIRTCGSVSTLMCGLLRDKGIALTAEEATLLMLGVYEDTGRLLFMTTGRDDFLAAAWLLEQGAHLNVVADSLSVELTGQQVDLLNRLLKGLKTTEINGVPISIAHAACDTYVPDIAEVAHIVRDMENLDVLFMALAVGDRVFLVGRSRLPEVDAGEILRHFGGGGHAAAASATIHASSLKKVLEDLETHLRSAVTLRNTAGAIMSSPVKTMAEDTTILRARELLTRYNCNAMPIMREKQMLGVISRKTVEKALYHDLGESPVTDFMQTEFIRADPDTPLTDLQEYMVLKNRRFVPVFAGDRLVGAVTRTDMMRQMYGYHKRNDPGALFDLDSLATVPRNRSITGTINKRLPKSVTELLRKMGRVGDELGLPVYAVGGFVRDLLLGVENLDIDVTVEGDGIFFAERLAAEHGGRVRSHEIFGTAVVVFPDGSKLDVASTRLEYYESPGVLPTVERASLRHDLYRRDFTINTLAICLNASCFGTLTDYFGGRQDLQDRIVRVLHNLSFVEDPTRLFRAIRFEQRLGFRLAPHTENLIRTGIRMNVLDKVSGRRIFNELMLILQEKEPVAALVRLSQLGLLARIHPSLKLVPETLRVLHETAQVLAWYRLLYLEESCHQWQVYFLALCNGLNHYEFEQACERLGIPGKMITGIFAHRRPGVALLDEIHTRLRRGPEISPSQIYTWFHGLPLEILLYLAGRTGDEQARRFISHYITSLRLVRCSLNGDRLRELGVPQGPYLGQLKARLLAARLDGQIRSEADEMEMVRAILSNHRNHCCKKTT